MSKRLLKNQSMCERESLELPGQNLVNMDLTPFEFCKHIYLLDLSYNKLKYLNLSPLVHLKKLQRVLLNQNRLQTINLEPLQECNSLEFLNLYKNSIHEINLNPLSNKPVLYALNLKRNPLSQVDVSPLFSCSKLTVFKINSKVQLSATENYKTMDAIPIALKEYLGKIDQYELEEEKRRSVTVDEPILKDPSAGVQKDSLFYCQLCETRHSGVTPRLQCESCGQYVCVDAFNEMRDAFQAFQQFQHSCPMCDGQMINI